jgi:molybdate transport system substrate-binding protein
VEPHLARGENVRAALAYVARGDAPLGIVYGTDARAEKRIRVVAVFPADTHPPIVYPAAVTAQGRAEAARMSNSCAGSPRRRSSRATGSARRRAEGNPQNRPLW